MEEKKNKDADKNKQQAGQAKNETDWLNELKELAKNPLLTGIAGYFIGRWHANYDNRQKIQELEEKINRLTERKEISESKPGKSDPGENKNNKITFF